LTEKERDIPIPPSLVVARTWGDPTCTQEYVTNMEDAMTHKLIPVTVPFL